MGPQPVQARDPLDAAINDHLLEGAQRRASQAYLAAHPDLTSDKALDLLTLQAASGLPYEQVQADPEGVRAKVGAARIRRTLATNPVLQEYLQDPAKLHVFKDHVEDVSTLSKYLLQPFVHGAESLLYGELAASQSLGKNPLALTREEQLQFADEFQPLVDAGVLDPSEVRIETDAEQAKDLDDVIGGLEQDVEQNDPRAGMGTTGKLVSAIPSMVP